MLFGSKPFPPEDLKIELAAPPGWTFAPGDTIIGNVVRKAHLITPDATLSLSLGGQTATKVEEASGDNKCKYKAHWNLLGLKSDELFRGSLHIPEGDEYLTFPFEATIPTRPSAFMIKRRRKPESYLRLDADAVAQHILPGTFSCFGYNSRLHSRGSIEYHLEAVLRYSRGGSIDTRRATRSIVLRHLLAEPPLFDYEIKRCTSTRAVRSQRLVPGMEHAQLSFRQKMQKFFGSSKVPQFTYKMEIGVPKKVQLDNPNPIPFTMKIVPVPSLTSEVARGVPQNVQVHSICLSMNAITDLRAPGPYNIYDVHYNHQCKRYSVYLRDSVNFPMVLSVGKEGSELIDLGTMFEICLTTDGFQRASPRLRTKPLHYDSIYPCFVSYLIKHIHSISWEVSLSIAGETQKISSQVPLKVLAAD